ncbi:MAG: ADP-dependent glucokinase/phosphofructokinase [Candidatus Micrarchaeota archaeon]
MSTLTNVWYRNWQAKLKSVAFTDISNVTTLCAFNALTDKVITYNSRSFAPLFNTFEKNSRYLLKKANSKISRVDSPAMLAAALLQCFKTGKAMHVPANQQLLNWLESTFSTHGSIGGQAGIIANQLALLGGKPILYTSPLSPQLAQLFSPRVKFPVAGNDLTFIPVTHAGQRGKHSKTNFVIEFQKGAAIRFNGAIYVAPRANRIILSSPYMHPPLFETELVHFLPRLGEKINAGIFSGYQALQPLYEDGTTYEYYLSLEELYLTMLKSHKNVPLHVEYVSTPFKDVDKMIYEHITKHVDSFGLNEIELVELSEKLGFSRLGREIVKKENVVTLHAAAYQVLNALQLKRLHVHNLGYHLVLLKKPIDIASQRKQVNGVLFGSLVATSRALHGKEITKSEVHDALSIPVTQNGLNQMAQMCAHLSLSRPRAEHALLTGIFDMHDHIALVIPGQVAPLLRKTVGLGDTVSACSFIAGL